MSIAYIELHEEEFNNMQKGDIVFAYDGNKVVIDDVYCDGDFDCLMAQDTNGNHYFVGDLYKKKVVYDTPFIDDAEKISDMLILSKEEFLMSYSYLTEEEYDLTARAIMEILAANPT